MGLIDTLALRQRTPTVMVLLDSRAISARTILDLSVDFGYDNRIAEATIRLTTQPNWFDFGQSLEIRLGWNGFSIPVFSGRVSEESRVAFPSDVTILAQGRMALTEAEAVTDEDGIVWANKTDIEIINDCLASSGVTVRDIEGDGTAFGVEEDIVLSDGSSYASLIDEIDGCLSYYTFDCPDGVVRRRLITGVPSVSAAFSYVEGATGATRIIGTPRRNPTIRNVRNRVVVNGNQDMEVYAARQAANSYVPVPPTYRTLRVDSSLIETDTIADAIAVRKMLSYNRAVDTVTFRTPGNPYAMPGMSVALTSASLGLTSATNYWARHIRHSFNLSDGFITDWTLEGGVGDAGYDTGHPPLAMFTVLIECETDTTGTYYLIKCTNASSDRDTASNLLTLAWENDQNADTGSGETYQTVFTAAQVPAIITLTVTDPEANTDSIAQTIDPASATVLYREWNHAFYTLAESSASGGQIWYTWAADAGAHVISTPPLAPVGTAMFGLDDGRLVQSLDNLVTAPTLLKTFGSAVNAIWVNEADSSHITVGLESGQVQYSEDSGATWRLLHTFGAAVVWVEESYGTFGEMRVCSGDTEWISNDYCASVRAGATFTGGLATKTTLSPFGNYAGGTVLPGASAELGAPIDLSALDDDIRAITHDAQTDSLYLLNRDGRAFHLVDGDAAPTERTAIPDATGVNHALRDGDITGLLYACDETAGLVKSFDAMETWRVLRTGNGTTLRSRMIGYGAAPLTVIAKTGRRVLIGTWNGDVFYTENIWAATPVWVESSAGLTGDLIVLRLDPFDNDRAYCLSSGELWTNPNVWAGGTWVKILDGATIIANMAAAGVSPAGHEAHAPAINAFDVSIASDGFIAVSVWCDKWTYSGGTWYDLGWRATIWHTHNRGATWETPVEYYNNTSGAPYPGGRASLVVGQHDANRIYWEITGGSGNSELMRSPDGGHTYDVHVVISGDWFHRLVVPYDENPSDLICYAAANDGGQHVRKTIDGGVSWSNVSAGAPQTTNHARFHIDPRDVSKAFIITGPTGRVNVSTDTMASWTDVAGDGVSGYTRDTDLFPMADGTARYYAIGCLGAPYSGIATSSDLVTWRAVDLAAAPTLITGAQCLTLDPRY